jgi:hypothetical protein
MYIESIEKRETEIRYLERIQSKLASYEENVSDSIGNSIYILQKEIAVLKIMRFIKNNQYKVQK